MATSQKIQLILLLSTVSPQLKSNWDVNKVEDMNSVFYAAYAFDQPIDSWDTGQVLSLSFAFRNASSFNQDLNGWDVTSLTSLGATFYDADIFNGNIVSSL